MQQKLFPAVALAAFMLADPATAAEPLTTTEAMAISEALDFAISLSSDFSEGPLDAGRRSQCDAAVTTLFRESERSPHPPQMGAGIRAQLRVFAEQLDSVCASGVSRLDEIGLQRLVRLSLKSRSPQGATLADILDLTIGSYWTVKLKTL